MPKITSVEPQKKNPKRFNIFLDGQFGFGADEDLIVECRLIVGKEISPENLEKILFEAEVGKLVARIYSLLNIRLRTEKEIRDYLKNLSFKRKLKNEEGISEVVIGSLIDKLKEKDLINDERFAKEWVEVRSKKKGFNLIKSELFKKGVGREIIEEALNSEFRIQNSEEVATNLLEKRVSRFKGLPYLEQKQKALEFLMRRGFEYSIAKEVVEKLIKKDYNNS